MPTGAITGYIDVAQLVLYGFWIFFAGLIWYLVRENKREGYPLITDRPDRLVEGIPPMPQPKTFLLGEGRAVSVPRAEAPQQLHAVPAAPFPGAPLIPIGDPLLSGMGPGAYAHRHDAPDLTFDDQLPKIVPLRVAPSFFLAWEDPDPRGYSVMGCDGVVAGTVVDSWVDRSEVVIRYLEVALADAAHHVLLPMNFADFRHKQQLVKTRFIRGAQFAAVPTTASPDQVTMLEEEKILAFFGGGLMYATPDRAESLL